MGCQFLLQGLIRSRWGAPCPASILLLALTATCSCMQLRMRW